MPGPGIELIGAEKVHFDDVEVAADAMRAREQSR